MKSYNEYVSGMDEGNLRNLALAASIGAACAGCNKDTPQVVGLGAALPRIETARRRRYGPLA